MTEFQAGRFGPDAESPSPGPDNQSRSAPSTASGVPAEELYPPDVIGPEPRGISGAGAAAIGFAIIAVILFALMVTGYNNSVPYLHPPSQQSGVTVAGDREHFTYLFVNNGTYDNFTVSDLCSNCPLTLNPGSQFTYTIDLVNPFNHSIELTNFLALVPFHLDGYSPGGGTVVGGMLSQPMTLQMTAPSTGGAYTLDLDLTLDVA